MADMKQVEREALLIWQQLEQKSLRVWQDEQLEASRQYTRENVRMWMLHWRGVCSEARKSFAWSDVKNDIEHAISCLNRPLQDLFDFYCVLECDEDEVCEKLRWKPQYFTRSWRMLVDKTYAILSDRRVRQVSELRKQANNPYIQVTDLPVKLKL